MTPANAMLSKRNITQEFILSNSFYMKFHSRYSDCLGLEVRMVKREELRDQTGGYGACGCWGVIVCFDLGAGAGFKGVFSLQKPVGP